MIPVIAAPAPTPSSLLVVLLLLSSSWMEAAMAVCWWRWPGGNGALGTGSRRSLPFSGPVRVAAATAAAPFPAGSIPVLITEGSIPDLAELC